MGHYMTSTGCHYFLIKIAGNLLRSDIKSLLTHPISHANILTIKTQVRPVFLYSFFDYDSPLWQYGGILRSGTQLVYTYSI